jgi:large-conductance mechanosensitive channel
MEHLKRPEETPAPALTDEAKLLIEIRDLMQSGLSLR